MAENEKKICEVNYCEREAMENDEYCIFHSQNIKGKKGKFLEAFRQEFERQRKEEKTYAFAGFVFPDNFPFVYFNKYDKDVYFNFAQFNGTADFGLAQFSGKAYFGEARFSGRAIFGQAQFSGDAHFVYAQFSGEANFSEAQFSGEADFREAQFYGEADFRETRFYGRGDFLLARFSEWAAFHKAQFYGMANFQLARFSGEAYFITTQFSGGANFSVAQFSRRTFFLSAQFSGVAEFFRAEFLEIVYFYSITIEKYHDFNMDGTYLTEVEGLFEFMEENRKEFAYSQKQEFLPDGFRLILGEKAVARYPIISRKIKDDMYLLRFKQKHPKLHFAWWLFADCGRSFLRWAGWSLGIALFFAVIFLLIGPNSFKAKPEGYTWFSFFYYSFVTFTTLGFGDITPIKWFTEILVTIEVILGYVMLGGLISILANKLARRS